MPDDLMPTTVTEDRFEHVLAELLREEEAGTPVNLSRALEAAPDLEMPLREYFRNRDGFDRLAPCLAPTLTPAARAAPPPEVPAGSRFAGYEIISEIGRGGMGIVYHAWQLSPQREVALKVIRTDRLAELSADEQRHWLERFRREAQLVASLEQHPNLVTLYEVGEHEGRPFFTMQLVRGGSLATLRKGVFDRSLLRSVAKLVATVARAVHHVHQRGVLHRDLKPGNILLDTERRPLVSDFGLARRLDQSGSLVAGAIEGTVEYMAPEQARGLPGAVTTAADVYSLGAVLYALLTGRPPLRGASDFETLMLVMGEAPAPPRSLNARLPRDLETICLNCLDKEPGRRYASAAALADDLDNWLAGRPIHARPVGVAGRLWRWCRRNPALATAAAAVLVIASVAVGLIVQSRNDAIHAAGVATEAKEQAKEAAEKNFDLAQRNGILAKQEEDQRRAVQRELTRLAVQEGLNLCENQADCARGLPCLVYGLETAEQIGGTELAHAIRANLAVWGRSVIPQRAVLVHENWPEIHQAVFSPNSRIVATACGDGAIRLWDTATGKLSRTLGAPRRPGQLPPPKDVPANPTTDNIVMIAPEDDPAFAVAFSPDGRWVAGGSLRGRVRLWEVASGRLLRELQHHDGTKDDAFRSNRGKTYTKNSIVGLAFRPDGKTLMAAGQAGLIRIWDPTNGETLKDLQNPGMIEAVTLSPDGRSLLVGCTVKNKYFESRGLAVLWDTTTGKWRYDPLLHHGPIHAIAFSPDGRWFATGCDHSPQGGNGNMGEAQLWETATGKPVGPASTFKRLVEVLAFNPDGRHWLAACSDGTVRLFDREQGLQFETRIAGAEAPGSTAGSMFGPGVTIGTAAFSPDGRTFVTAGEGIQSWDINGKPICAMPKVHRSTVEILAFSSDGRTLLTAAQDGTARLWEAPTARQPPDRSLSLFNSASRLVFSRDGQRILIGTLGPGALLVESGGSKPPVLLKHGMAPAVDLSADGHLALTGSYDGTVRLWDLTKGVILGELTGVERVTDVVISPDSRTIAIAGEAFSPDGGGVSLCDVASHQGQPLRLLKGVSVWSIAFSPDSQTIAAAAGGKVRLYRVSDGGSTGIVLEPGEKADRVAFSPNGALLLTAGSSSKARLWDAKTGKALRDFPHRRAVVAASFSADGQTVLTASLDGTAQLWRTATGERAGPALVHPQAVTAAALGRDGRTALTGCSDGTVRLWDALAGLPIGPPGHHGVEVYCVALSPDGRTAVWAGKAKAVGFRSVPPPLTGPVARVRLWAEALTGFTHDTDQAIRLLEPGPWQKARDSVRRDAEELLAIDSVTTWHRREATECELTGQWFPAQWHLQQLLRSGPDDGELLRRCGLALAHLDGPARAAELLSRAITHGADSAEVRLERGKAYSQLGLRDRAEADFAEGIQKWPNAWALWQARGSLRAEAERWREAAKDLQRAAELPGAPALAGSQYALACLHLRDLAGYKAACAGLVRRLDQHQPPKLLVPDTAEVVWPCCLCPTPAVDPALLGQLAERAVGPAEIGKQSYPLARALGASLYRAGKYERAVEVLNRAAELNKQAPTVWLLLAMSYHQLGNAKEAQRALDAARAWMSASHQEERLAHRIGWATGMAGAPRGFASLGALAPFTNVPLADMTKGERRARPWRQIPWTEQLALEMLRFEAENLIASMRSGR
jgi:WD40 repeat protein/tetratricopeptide (TPR) repeat protein